MIPSLRVVVGRYEIRIAAVPAVIALLLLAVLLSAGFWQLRRAEEKREILAEQSHRSGRDALTLSPDRLSHGSIEDLRYRRAVVTGRYRGDVQYLLDNRTHDHVAGYHVLTPLRIQGSDAHVLVNRGWLPVGPDRGRLPDIAVDSAVHRAEGTIVAPPAAGLVLGPTGYDAAGWPRVVQLVDLDLIARELDAPLLPFVLRLSPASEQGYTREWPAHTGLSPERHLGYAVQWFALAVALVVLCAWIAVKRKPEESDLGA